MYVGWNGILAEQEGRRHHDQTVAVPPPKQAMYTYELQPHMESCQISIFVFILYLVFPHIED